MFEPAVIFIPGGPQDALRVIGTQLYYVEECKDKYLKSHPLQGRCSEFDSHRVHHYKERQHVQFSNV